MKQIQSINRMYLVPQLWEQVSYVGRDNPVDLSFLSHIKVLIIYHLCYHYKFAAS
jgi:hypothetical protein